jgi:hypothetical protein
MIPRTCYATSGGLGIAARAEPSPGGVWPRLRSLSVRADEFTIVPGYVGACYGAPTEASRRARDLMRDLEGIQLETTYSAKCLAALIDVAQHRGYRDTPVPFWNTYSSVDLRRQLPLPDYTRLPPAFHRFFTGTPWRRSYRLLRSRATTGSAAPLEEPSLIPQSLWRQRHLLRWV